MFEAISANFCTFLLPFSEDLVFLFDVVRVGGVGGGFLRRFEIFGVIEAGVIEA
jgi:hypothetical protein